MENPLLLKSYDDATDENLIEIALQGDKKSLNELLIRHQDYIFNIALKMLNGVAEAEDATQEILIKLVTKLAKYDPSKGRFRTWLYRISFNHILNLKQSAYEKHEVTFSKFFKFMDSVPDIPITEEEEEFMGESVEEATVTCTAGMLMCLDRDQRLVYIVGEIFKIDHNLAAEIFEITPANFRQKLSRTRKDIHQWMHRKCGLVNPDNPCRCRNKTKSFIQQGIVDPNNRKWHSNYQRKINDLLEEKYEDMGKAMKQIEEKIFQAHPFKTSLKSGEIYQEILNHNDFRKFMDL